MMTHVEELKNFESTLRKRFTELNELKSKYDLSEQDILHYIEFEKYDAVSGSKLLKKLKEVRRERRAIKNEYEELQSILKRFETSGLHKFRRTNKNYTYRVVSLESLLSDDTLIEVTRQYHHDSEEEKINHRFEMNSNKYKDTGQVKGVHINR